MDDCRCWLLFGYYCGIKVGAAEAPATPKPVARECADPGEPAPKALGVNVLAPVGLGRPSPPAWSKPAQQAVQSRHQRPRAVRTQAQTVARSWRRR